MHILEIIMLSEISYSHKDNYHVFSYRLNYRLTKRHESRRGIIEGRGGNNGRKEREKIGKWGMKNLKVHYTKIYECHNEANYLIKLKIIILN
jgi:hypothetical protein